ncbi:MAG TPA: cytochrome c [Bacteroidia bacterium]|nr:cytochrome c [Bacteroidia bacterium]
MKTFNKFYLIIAVLLMPLFIFAQTGENLFHQNCAACHTIGNGKLVGPDLKGIEQIRSVPWLLKWIPSSQTFIKSGDKSAKKLFMDNNQIPMPDQALSQAQIKDILAYITQVGGGAKSNDAEVANTATSTKKESTDKTSEIAKGSVTNTTISSEVQTTDNTLITKPKKFIFDSLRGNNENLIIVGITLIVFLLVIIMLLLNVIKGLSIELSEELHYNKRYADK